LRFEPIKLNLGIHRIIDLDVKLEFLSIFELKSTNQCWPLWFRY